MRGRRHVSWPFLALLLVAAVPDRAFAQAAGKIEVAGGYSFVRDYDGDATFPRGWFASVAGDIAGPVSAVADFAGSYKSMGGLDVDLTLSIHTFMGGPRLSWRSDRTTSYAQMLFGVGRIATTFQVPEETLSMSENYFAMAPGGGIDIRFSDHGALRVGGGFRMMRTETFTETGTGPFYFKEFQFITGIVWR